MQAITETASMTMRSVINDTLGNDVQLKAVAADENQSNLNVTLIRDNSD